MAKRIKLMRPRLKSGTSRLKTLKARPVLSDARIARKEMYASAEWRKLRAEVRKNCPLCVICGAKTAVVDHCLGHRDDVVAMLIEVYDLRGVEPHWRDRFWQKNLLIGLCESDHNRKTELEGRGELGKWLEQHGHMFGLPLLPSHRQTKH